MLYPISTIDLLIVVYGIWVLARGAYLMFMSFRNGHFGWNAYTVYNAILVVFWNPCHCSTFFGFSDCSLLYRCSFNLTAISEILYRC